MIKGLVKGEGCGRSLELSRGATVVRRSARKESLSAFICHFLLPFLATLIICKSRQSRSAVRDKTGMTKYQLPATKLKAVIRISGTGGN